MISQMRVTFTQAARTRVLLPVAAVLSVKDKVTIVLSAFIVVAVEEKTWSGEKTELSAMAAT